METSIPLVDFSLYSLDRDATSEDSLAEEILKAFRDLGFCYIRNHGIPQNLIADAFRFSKEFFDLPLATKKIYSRSSTNHLDHEGYYPQELESTDPDSPYPDLKELYHFVRNGNPMRLPMDVIPEFKDSMDKLYTAFEQLAYRMMDIMAIGLKIKDPTYFRKQHTLIGQTGNNSTLRTLYYPPVKEYKNGQLRCGEHSDFGFLTFLLQDTAGLEVKDRKGKYIPVNPLEGTIVVNAGDMLERWTSDKIISPKHRVVVPDGKEMHEIGRQSLGFFVNPDDKALIEEIDGVGKYQPITTEEYLLQKLTQILNI